MDTQTTHVNTHSAYDNDADRRSFEIPAGYSIETHPDYFFSNGKPKMYMFPMDDSISNIKDWILKYGIKLKSICEFGKFGYNSFRLKFSDTYSTSQFTAQEKKKIVEFIKSMIDEGNKLIEVFESKQ